MATDPPGDADPAGQVVSAPIPATEPQQFELISDESSVPASSDEDDCDGGSDFGSSEDELQTSPIPCPIPSSTAPPKPAVPPTPPPSSAAMTPKSSRGDGNITSFFSTKPRADGPTLAGKAADPAVHVRVSPPSGAGFDGGHTTNDSLERKRRAKTRAAVDLPVDNTIEAKPMPVARRVIVRAAPSTDSARPPSAQHGRGPNAATDEAEKEMSCDDYVENIVDVKLSRRSLKVTARWRDGSETTQSAEDYITYTDDSNWTDGCCKYTYKEHVQQGLGKVCWVEEHLAEYCKDWRMEIGTCDKSLNLSAHRCRMIYIAHLFLSAAVALYYAESGLLKTLDNICQQQHLPGLRQKQKTVFEADG